MINGVMMMMMMMMMMMLQHCSYRLHQARLNECVSLCIYATTGTGLQLSGLLLHSPEMSVNTKLLIEYSRLCILP